jgi:hypothetical protein
MCRDDTKRAGFVKSFGWGRAAALLSSGKLDSEQRTGGTVKRSLAVASCDNKKAEAALPSRA